MLTEGMNQKAGEACGRPSELSYTVQSSAAHTLSDISWGSVGEHEALR